METIGGRRSRTPLEVAEHWLAPPRRRLHVPLFDRAHLDPCESVDRRGSTRGHSVRESAARKAAPFGHGQGREWA